MRYDNPELRRQLASAYALGSLSPLVRSRFKRLLRDDVDLQALVDDAQFRLAPLALTLEPVTPSATVWKAIDQRLELTAPARTVRWFDRLLRPALGWAVVGVMVGFVGGQLIPDLGRGGSSPPALSAVGKTQLPPSYVGVLANEAGGAGLLVSSLRHGRSADFKFVKPETPPEGQVFYLWGLPADGSAAVAIGPLPAGSQGSIALDGTAEALLANVSRLAVTLEPLGTEPAEPGLPYRYLGFCGKFWP